MVYIWKWCEWADDKSFAKLWNIRKCWHNIPESFELQWTSRVSFSSVSKHIKRKWIFSKKIFGVYNNGYSLGGKLPVVPDRNITISKNGSITISEPTVYPKIRRRRNFEDITLRVGVFVNRIHSLHAKSLWLIFPSFQMDNYHEKKTIKDVLEFSMLTNNTQDHPFHRFGANFMVPFINMVNSR